MTFAREFCQWASGEWDDKRGQVPLPDIENHGCKPR
jgi:hypothetical protein